MNSRMLPGCAAILLAVTAFAQVANQTALVGTITDGAGRAVAGAPVTAINTGTGDTYNTTTNEQGLYQIQFIRTGKYELTVAQPGFQTFKAVDIEVGTNQIVRTDIALKIGELK